MSLIDVTTGEVIEVANREQVEQLVARCSAAIAHMNARTGEAIEAMLDAYNGKAWIALGLGSWAELVEAKGWRWAPLTSADRAAYGELLRSKGMSLRAIAVTAGISHQTVSRDLAGVPNGTPDVVTGADGKTYPASRPEPTPAADEDEAIEEAEPEQSGEGGTRVPPTEQAAVEPVPAAPVEGDGDASAAEPSPRPLSDVRKLSDLAGPTDQWRLRFDKATASVISLLTSFPAADVLQFADAEQINDLDVLRDCLTSWVAEIHANRPTGLRAIEGGRS